MKTSTERSIGCAGSAQTFASPAQSFDPRAIRTILVAIDFSEESFGALEFALLLAQRFGASVQLIYVYEKKPQFSSLVNAPELFSDPAAELFSDREISGRLRNEVERRFSILLPATNCHYRAGRASDEIRAAADDLNADLLIVATRGRTGLKHLTLGSTAEKIVRHTNCPVLVVRHSLREPAKDIAGGIFLRKILVCNIVISVAIIRKEKIKAAL